MKQIAVIYGGRSPEHDISILTGLHCAKHITDDYRVRLVYMTKENKFLLGKPNIDDYISGKCNEWTECYFANGGLYRAGLLNKKLCDCFCAVNCCHGGSGENGELAAVMSVANIPITSCDYISAHNQQSKIATRKILSAHGFAQPKFNEVSKLEYDYLGERVIDGIGIDFPVIVKPNDLGSSIGITVAKTKDELLNGLELAFTMCDTAVVEEYIADMREVNIAVMRHNGELLVSAPEAVGGKKFFSFDEKYLNSESGFIKKGCGTDDEFVKQHETEIGNLAKRAYQIFGSSGVVRSDFIIANEADKYPALAQTAETAPSAQPVNVTVPAPPDARTILNENNTVPGFMAYHLWLRSGIPYGVVIDGMIDAAVKQFRRKQMQKTEFNSEILEKNRNLVVN